MPEENIYKKKTFSTNILWSGRKIKRVFYRITTVFSNISNIKSILTKSEQHRIERKKIQLLILTIEIFDSKKKKKENKMCNQRVTSKCIEYRSKLIVSFIEKPVKIELCMLYMWICLLCKFR